jgi:branched-chain amino acid aminotransferase
VSVVAWLDGQLVPTGQPALRVDDHGFIAGDGVFETMKVVDGRPFALTRHLRRLQRSAAGLDLPVDLDAVHAGIDAVLAGSPRGLARLRVTVSAGPAPLSSERGQLPPTVLVAVSPAEPPAPVADVVVVPFTRNERSAVAGFKTTSYADNVMALRYAQARRGTEAVLANTRGELCEGTGSNVFVARQGRLVTPPLSSGCLAGVTRELLIEWLGDVLELPLPVAALFDCDEVFLASSLRDVQPVRSVDGQPVAEGRPGPLTMRAAEVFAKHAAANPDP